MRTFATLHNAKVSIATVCTAGLLLVGCGPDENNEQQPTQPNANEDATLDDTGTNEHDAPDTDEDGSDIDEDSAEPVGEFSTELQESEDWPAFGETEGIYPVDVRSAVHDGFERIVIEHAGTGIPSHMAQYTEEPAQPGSGEPIDTGDAAYLEVIASGTASVEDIDEDQMLDNGEEITAVETQATGTVVSFAPWEATSNYFIGLDEQRPYAVTVIDDPVRIVVDVQLEDGA